MKASLVNALRKGTDVLLDIDSHEITLIPHQRVQKPGGAYDWVEQPARPPQRFNIEPSLGTRVIDSGGDVRTSEAGGTAHGWTFVLKGRHDAQIAIGDVWYAGETTYRVISIQPRNEYDTTAVIAAIGKDPVYGT